MTISVVIPVYNGLEFLKSNFKNVMDLKVDEVIVIDDASQDGSYDYVRKNFPGVKLSRHNRNQRFPLTVNELFSKATGDLVVLLNQDVLIKSDILKVSLPHFADRKVFAVTLHEHGHSWASVTFENGFVNYTNGPESNKPCRSFWGSGGSAIFRREYWEELGGFDPMFTPGYNEDMDIGWRAWKRGYSVVWEPKAHVEHAHESIYSRSIDPLTLRRVKERNYLLCHWRNLDTSSLLDHKLGVLRRCLLHPGYLLPVIMAMKFLPSVIAFRLQEKRFVTLPDSRLFTYFHP